MFDSRRRRLMIFLASLLIFGAAFGLLRQEEARVCMGVKILTEKDQAEIREYIYLDLSRELTHNDQPAAVDVENSTIYISQKIQQGTEPKDLMGKLKITSSSHQLSFAPDEAFTNLAEAVAQGHAFKLNVIDNVGRCMQYRVVFTTLPVLRLDSVQAHQDESGTDVLEGNLCLWAPEDPDTGRYSVKSSGVQWHVRGYTTAMLDKKSWKLSLKKKNGSNENLSFLGLGADDDWILNAMRLDDTKLKEKLFIDLWNSWAEKHTYNYKMSAGEYVEVICDQTYAGVYLLQRRIDQKYYGLAQEDILLKGKNTEIPLNLQDFYEVIYSPLDETETLALMDEILTGTGVSMVQPDNFLDVTLFLQYGSAIDNAGFKNMFYLLKKQGDSYQLSMIPWDTDMSWGVTFVNGFVYDYHKSMNHMPQRREYSAMLQEYPELESLLASRWNELRQTVFAEENILKELKANQATLEQSGALHREIDWWGLMFEGDTKENLSLFLQERLLRLDEYYSQ